ncbi:hypothetical protein Droror1_Dr00005450 [Drosera rotundifolia]
MNLWVCDFVRFSLCSEHGEGGGVDPPGDPAGGGGRGGGEGDGEGGVGGVECVVKGGVDLLEALLLVVNWLVFELVCGVVFVRWKLLGPYVLLCGELGSARRQVFDEMLVRDLVSWNSMICGYAQWGQFGDVLCLFGLMRGAEVFRNMLAREHEWSVNCFRWLDQRRHALFWI